MAFVADLGFIELHQVLHAQNYRHNILYSPVLAPQRQVADHKGDSQA